MDPSQMQLRCKATFAPIAVRAVIKKTRFKMDSLKALAYRHYFKKKKKDTSGYSYFGGNHCIKIAYPDYTTFNLNSR